MASAEADPRAAELAQIIAEIRERVRSRHPESAGGVPLPDLEGVLHARDAAEGKVAAIGSVNPRPPGLVNNTIQSAKRSIARALGWFVREQVEFNQAAVDGLTAVLDSLNEFKRSMAGVAVRAESVRGHNDELAQELRDLHARWTQAQREWERRLSQAEIALLRSVADLGAAQRVQIGEETAKLGTAAQELRRELERARLENEKLRSDFEKVRLEYERLIHQELRVLRQRTSAVQPVASPTSGSTAAPSFDYTRFAERFRGSEEDIRDRMRRYVPLYGGRNHVLDIGCGRGELLQLLRDAGVTAKGIDLDEDSVAYCRGKGLAVERADVFEYLASQPPFDGIFCAQVVEHLPPERLPDLIRLCSDALTPGGVIVFETPNPECLAIFATHFYLDPTHTRPVPPQLLVFYLEEFGFGAIGVERIAPAVDSLSGLASIPADFRDAFFGGLDYFIAAKKL